MSEPSAESLALVEKWFQFMLDNFGARIGGPMLQKDLAIKIDDLFFEREAALRAAADAMAEAVDEFHERIRDGIARGSIVEKVVQSVAAYRALSPGEGKPQRPRRDATDTYNYNNQAGGGEDCFD